MKKILLSNINEYALVDDDKYYLLISYTWSLSTNKGAVTAKVNRVSTSMGLFLLKVKKGSGLEVDHVDRNIYNNQLSNLRVATKSQNNANRGKLPGCSSKYKGVSLEENRWRASIKVKGKRISLGCYSTEVEAAIVYNEHAKLYFKEFAALNEVENA